MVKGYIQGCSGKNILGHTLRGGVQGATQGTHYSKNPTLTVVRISSALPTYGIETGL